MKNNFGKELGLQTLSIDEMQNVKGGWGWIKKAASWSWDKIKNASYGVEYSNGSWKPYAK